MSDDNKWTVVGRTLAMNGFLAKAYIKHIQSSQHSQSAVSINDIIIHCGDNGVPATTKSPVCKHSTGKEFPTCPPDYPTFICNSKDQCVEGLCQKCLLDFISEDALLNNSDSKAVESLETGVCQGCCICGVSNISQRSGIVFDTNSNVTVTDQDYQAMADDIMAQMESAYPDTPPNTKSKQSLINILTTINEKVVQNTNQSLSTATTIVTDGAGSSVRNVSEDLVVNAVMNAIQGDSNAVSQLQAFVNQEISNIKQDVDKSVISSFSDAWQSSKSLIIIVGIAFLVIILGIVVLTIKKALTHAG